MEKNLDEKFIDIAIDISQTAESPYGAIVVRNGEIIGRSDSISKGDNVLYGHSEYRAIQDAINSGNAKFGYGGLNGGLENCVLYTSCEPCMMCFGLILYRGIRKVVYAASIKDASTYVSEELEADIRDLAKLCNKNIEIVPNLHQQEAVEVLKRFKTRIEGDRKKHIWGVAEFLEHYAKNNKFSSEECGDLYTLGLLHDIGYQFLDHEHYSMHNKVGGEKLKEQGYKYWKEVYYHGETSCEYKSKYLDLLNWADMHIDSSGKYVTFDDRLKELSKRYHIPIQKLDSYPMVQELK